MPLLRHREPPERAVLPGLRADRHHGRSRRRDAAHAKKGGRSDRVRTALADPHDEELFQELRKLRLELAREQGVPPYVIFHDATLVEMARDKPRDERDLARLSGVGRTKLETYGDAFLDVISRYG